jgi:hypothetical protein
MRLSSLYSKPLSLPVTQAGIDLGTWDPGASITEGINFGASSKLLIPGVTETERLLSTPLEREILYDTTLKTIYYGDGVTLGGLPVGSGSGDAISLIVAAANT